MTTTTTLLLVDVQNDFHPGGSLAIPTANEDAIRTADFINKNVSTIDRIVCTMDSHHKLHIAHPKFWRDAAGNNPNPFTVISMKDVVDGKWIPRSDIKRPRSMIDPAVFTYGNDDKNSSNDDEFDMKQYCVEYTRRLEEKGRFQLCVWPEHCLVGSPGHNMVPIVFEALQKWSNQTGGSVEFIQKGQTLLTEMYSALAAEVPINESTSFNQPFHDGLLSPNVQKLLICGQAKSHCVNYTVRDIVEHWPTDQMNKITVLQDCTTSVPGFEEAGEQFVKDMKEKGVLFVNSTDV